MEVDLDWHQPAATFLGDGARPHEQPPTWQINVPPIQPENFCGAQTSEEPDGNERLQGRRSTI